MDQPERNLYNAREIHPSDQEDLANTQAIVVARYEGGRCTMTAYSDVRYAMAMAEVTGLSGLLESTLFVRVPS